MARQKGDPDNKGAAARARYQKQSEFVRYELTEKERETLKHAEFNEKNALEALVRLVEQEYKVTFRYDDFNSCHACWFVAPDSSDDNKGKILSGRGSTPLKALKQATWLHFERFHEIWPSQITRAEMEMDD